MTRTQQAAAFLGAFWALATFVTWFNLSVLCLGDPKFCGGCCGLELDVPAALFAYGPLTLLAAFLCLSASAAVGPRALVLALVATLVSLELVYVLDEWPWWELLAEYLIVLAPLVILRFRKRHAEA